MHDRSTRASSKWACVCSLYGARAVSRCDRCDREASDDRICSNIFDTDLMICGLQPCGFMSRRIKRMQWWERPIGLRAVCDSRKQFGERRCEAASLPRRSPWLILGDYRRYSRHLDLTKDGSPKSKHIKGSSGLLRAVRVSECRQLKSTHVRSA